MDGSALANAIRLFVGNIFLALAGVGAIAFLVRKEFVRLAEFAVLTVVIATFVYVPEMYRAMAEFVAGLVTG
jgi:hypothetical protein